MKEVEEVFFPGGAWGYPPGRKMSMKRGSEWSNLVILQQHFETVERNPKAEGLAKGCGERKEKNL